MKKFIPLFLALVLFIFIFLYFKNSREKNDLFSGIIEIKKVDVSFKISGRISKLYFEEGDFVKERDKLGELEKDDVINEIEKQSAILREAEAKLKELKKGTRERELELAKTNLKLTEVELEKAERDFERAEILYKNGAISSQKWENAKKVYELSLLQNKKAKETLELLKEGARDEEIEAQENKVKGAKAYLKTIEDKLKETEIFSPIKGIILNKYYEVGEIVNLGSPVYTIGDFEDLWVKIYVKEDKLGILKLGQGAEIISDSFPNKVYYGKISQISSEAEFTPKYVQTKDERTKLVFAVKIKIKNENFELKPGMFVDVRLLNE